MLLPDSQGDLTMAAINIPDIRARPTAARLICAAGLAVVGLAACSKFGLGQDEMSWARAALERNDRLEVVAADQQTSTFTVRLKDTSELRMIRVDQIIAGLPHAAGEAPIKTAASATSAAPPAPATVEAAAAGEPARAAPAEPAHASQATDAAAPDVKGGRVLASGPGYTIKAAGAKGAASPSRVPGRDSDARTASLERRHEPIICQGDRLLHIDNRNLEFDGDALSAEDGCEIHITNSRITAKGVGVTARSANVHITNSQIEGDSGSIDASGSAQVYAESSTFKGLSRRLDSAALHDLGGNVWN
jgi:hypothetical protein